MHPSCTSDLKDKKQSEVEEMVGEWYCDDCRERIRFEELQDQDIDDVNH